jgi:Transposase IS116/IS110/IS902 family
MLIRCRHGDRTASRPATDGTSANVCDHEPARQTDDPSRFRRSRRLPRILGFRPRRYPSGERNDPGRISKAGDVEVRSHNEVITCIYMPALACRLSRTDEDLGKAVYLLRFERVGKRGT